jgi:hypothetical protein
MTAGLPGTGIGGIFYLLLAICMPVCEVFRAAQKRTNVRRWGFISLQLLFVAGILTAMWGEVWLLNRTLFWLQQTHHLNLFSLNGPLTFRQTKGMATASALASFISLMLVMAAVYILRFFVSRPRNSTIRPLRIRKPSTRARYQAA